MTARSGCQWFSIYAFLSAPVLGRALEFPDELFVIGYLVISCILVLNDRVFHSNCKLFQLNLNFVEYYHFAKIYFHMIYFDFGTVLS